MLFDLIACVSRSDYRRCQDCVDENACGVRIVMQEVHDQTTDILDGMTLAGMSRQVEMFGPTKQHENA